MPYRYSKKELRDYFFEMVREFNDCMDANIREDNIYLEFFNPSNGIEQYERFCKERFPRYLAEPYKEEGYFESFAAQAFLNEKEYGVLLREDIDFSLSDLLLMLLHEISHLYCTRNEIGGDFFFEKYCMGTGPEDGMMNAGYAIWREAVADIMADSIISEYAQISLKDKSVRDEIKFLYDSINAGMPESKKAMSLIIAYTMISRQVAVTERWEEAENALKRYIRINDPLLFSALEQVFRQLHKSPYWVITPGFIMTLGETYLSILTQKLLKDINRGSVGTHQVSPEDDKLR